MQKKVLLFNYYWPPCGGSAVQRWLHFVKNFDRMGIHTDVITIDPEKATFPSWDESLLKEIPASTNVFTTDTGELFKLYAKTSGGNDIPKPSDLSVKHDSFKSKAARFVRGNFLLPDPRKGWNDHAFRKALELIPQNDYAAIITAGPPQSSHLIGLRLKKQFPQLTWIADFHDYWTDHFNLAFFYRTSLAQSIDRQLERKVLKHADHILAHTEKAKDLYNDKVSGIADKISVVRMGYDEEKMQQGKATPLPADGVFRITYTGIISALYAPEVFFRVVQQVREQLLEKEIRITFAGNVYEGLFDLVRQYGLETVFAYKGYLPHQESIDLLYQSDLLLLINPRDKQDQLIVPGKLFEYMATGRPTWSISSRGSENELILTKGNAGQNFDWSEEQAMLHFLRSVMEGSYQPEQTEAQRRYIRELGRAQQAKIIADLL